MRMTQLNRLRQALLPLIAATTMFATCGFRCDAHPFHISTAEMEYNHQTGLIEVSLKLHSLDLERAVTGSVGRKVSVERDSDHEFVRDYLSRHIYVVPQSELATNAGKSQRRETTRPGIALAGIEAERTWVWVHFEMGLPKTDGDLALVNTILCDVNEGQINTVLIRNGRLRTALKMTANQTWQPFSRTWLEESPKAETPLGHSDGR